MGLDIAAYSKLEPFEGEIRKDEKYGEDEFDWDWIDSEGLIRAFAYKGFEHSTRGLRNHDVETNEVLNGGEIAFSLYKETPETQTHRFRAGSYGGYNDFRDKLAQLVGYEEASAVWKAPEPLVGVPFYELINFADNEGCIGPEAAADLLEDFRQFRSRWVALVGNDDYYVAKYDDWTKACELAADGGLIDFH